MGNKINKYLKFLSLCIVIVSLIILPSCATINLERNSNMALTWTEVEDTSENTIYALVEFDGYIYAGTYNGALILRSLNGETWTQVLNIPLNETYVYAMAEFDGYLYAGTGSWGEIWRTANGTDWEEVINAITVDDSVLSLAEFDGYLYAGTKNLSKIYRTANGTDWAEVADLADTEIYALASFGGYLYAGTYDSGTIYRSSNGTDWVEVANAATIPGSWPRTLTVFGSHLYACAVSQISRTSNGTDWEEVKDFGSGVIVSAAVAGDSLYVGMTSGETYGSLDGEVWEAANNVIDDVYSLAVFEEYLYAGTSFDGKIYRAEITLVPVLSIEDINTEIGCVRSKWWLNTDIQADVLPISYTDLNAEIICLGNYTRERYLMVRYDHVPARDEQNVKIGKAMKFRLYNPDPLFGIDLTTFKVRFNGGTWYRYGDSRLTFTEVSYTEYLVYFNPPNFAYDSQIDVELYCEDNYNNPGIKLEIF